MRVRDMKIGIVGAGAMGRGIAQVCAQAGLTVYITDSSVAAYSGSYLAILEKLEKLEERGGLKEAAKEACLRIIPCCSLSRFSEVDFVIEAVYEDLETKRDIFAQLDKICPPHVIFATNTSSIPIHKIADATQRPGKCVGMHFMNPPALVPLLEMIAGQDTTQRTLRTTQVLSRLLCRNPVIFSKDAPGFVVNRIIFSAINEAASLLSLGIASVEDIDASVIIGVGSSRGMPILHLADLIGLDICVNILRVLAAGLGCKYEPVPPLLRLVEDGHLGRKTGRGFFTYE